MALDLSKPIQTRDGKPARILANDVKGDTENKIIALVDTGDEEILAIRLASGRLLEGAERPDDLVNAPERRVVYRNLYLGAPVSAEQIGLEWDTAEEAHGIRTAGILPSVTVQITEVDGEVVGVELA